MSAHREREAAWVSGTKRVLRKPFREVLASKLLLIREGARRTSNGDLSTEGTEDHGEHLSGSRRLGRSLWSKRSSE